MNRIETLIALGYSPEEILEILKKEVYETFEKMFAKELKDSFESSKLERGKGKKGDEP
ncbi:MAG: hypothetical protein ACE5K0_02680 [Candidatus Methanofastidiosia archaeon]